MKKILIILGILAFINIIIISVNRAFAKEISVADTYTADMMLVQLK